MPQNQISDVLEFQVVKKITTQARLCLELLEKDKENILKLEKLLDSVGFIDNELFKGENNFRDARKRVLDFKGDSERELIELFRKFDIKLK